MFIVKQGFFLRIFLTILIAFVSILGDMGLQNGKSEIVRAVCDNLTHASVGGLTWTLVLLLSKKYVVNNMSSVVICFFMSSFIDIDHFISAGSWDINDATHLNHRPFLHCSTIPVTLWIIMNLISNTLNMPNLITYAWMMLVSFMSHHVRDGNRRGLWFWPFGSTQPIPYYLYLSICMAIPYLVQWIMAWQLSRDIETLSRMNIV
ncbi:transmembrane protein 267 [Phymastichus coffea]|uniref:transmembrane protein 267 n=1 Tax=Phymastichus coffea TaxID=108790 RepID=UPI00273B338F|nr:transmembrane protein 267 [Phymastichus coffea]XP_058788556.1 transmembrane protein 267 [Phymastichus coffea]XP_058788557.1 transmembrane protein 267 [Phymastichus coffea]XP_058788558.1 transmembrane protein 267 [Phymastichus coffea]